MELKNPHEYLMAAQEASISTQTAVAVRNKALEAFNENHEDATVIETLKIYGTRVVTTLRQFTPGQITAIVIGVLALLVGAVLLLRVTASPLTPLYSNLSSEGTRSRSLKNLMHLALPTNSTQAVLRSLLPQKTVSTARLAMSAAGLPADAGSGYSLLDEQGMTTSQFMQNVTFQRALEVNCPQPLKALMVCGPQPCTLLFPLKRSFTQASDKPTASVLIVMGGGQILDGEQVQAITNLVASAVPGLTPDKVSVTDSSGMLLSGGGVAGAASVSQAARIEEGLIASAQAMLDKVLGPGVSSVIVNADLEFDQRSTTTQEYAYPEELPPHSPDRQQPRLTRQRITARATVPSWASLRLSSVKEPPPIPRMIMKKLLRHRRIRSIAPSRKELAHPETFAGSRFAVLVDAAVPAATFGEVEAIVANAVGLNVERGRRNPGFAGRF